MFKQLLVPFLVCSLFACNKDEPNDASVDVTVELDVASDVVLDAPVDESVQDTPVDDIQPRDNAVPDADSSADALVPDGDVEIPDAIVVDPCVDAILCEGFDTYNTAPIGSQTLGPWQPMALARAGDIFEVDGSFAYSGGKSLHTRIAATPVRIGGGRLFASPAVLGDSTTKLHGRMMMYVGANGVSDHWTLAGVMGPALPAIGGESASLLISSIRTTGRNQFAAKNVNQAQDCISRSGEFVSSNRWMCLQWSVDSEAGKVELSIDGTNILSVNGVGQSCEGNVPNDSRWVGPYIDRFYVGTFLFSALDASLETWIDDVVIDDAPIACP